MTPRPPVLAIRSNASVLGLMGRWMLALIFVSMALFSVMPLQPGNRLLPEPERALVQERLLWIARASCLLSGLLLWYALGHREARIDFARRCVTLTRVFPFYRSERERVAFADIVEVRVRHGKRVSDTITLPTRTVDLFTRAGRLRVAFEVDSHDDWPAALEEALRQG